MHDDLARYRAARDFLLAHRADYDAAVAASAGRSSRSSTGRSTSSTSSPAATRARRCGSSTTTAPRRACRSRSCGALQPRRQLPARRSASRRGDRILLMLGNVPPLWEVMLASIKLGAVIIPATTLLTPRRPASIASRAAACARSSPSAETQSSRSSSGTRRPHRALAWAAAPAGRARRGRCRRRRLRARRRHRRPTDPLLLYFTSGTTASRSSCCTPTQSYPVGHLSTMYWIGLQPGDVHSNISSPGWAKHAWSCFFAPWNAGATVFVYNYARFDAEALLDVLVNASA